MTTRQVKGGYLLRYKKRLLGKAWREEWVVLYEDSTLAWFKEKGQARPDGALRVREAPELLACSIYTQRVPCRPRLPNGCGVKQLLAVGTKVRRKVLWLLAANQQEVNDWMIAISKTLPPPPPPPPPQRCPKLISTDDKTIQDDPSSTQDLTANLDDKQNVNSKDSQGSLKQPLANKPEIAGERSAVILVDAEEEPDPRTQGTVDMPPNLMTSKSWGGWGHGGGWIVMCHCHSQAQSHTHAAHCSLLGHDHSGQGMHDAYSGAHSHFDNVSDFAAQGPDLDLGDADLGMDFLADFSF